MRYCPFSSSSRWLRAGAAARDAAPFTVGAGHKPGVAVDAAGTAYIAWYGPEAGTRRCSSAALPRGATRVRRGSATLPAAGHLAQPPVRDVAGARGRRILQYRYGAAHRGCTATRRSTAATPSTAAPSPGDARSTRPWPAPATPSRWRRTRGRSGGVVQTPAACPAGRPARRAPRSSHRPAVQRDGRARRPPRRWRSSPPGRRRRRRSGATSARATPNNAATWGAPVAIGYADYPRLAGGALGPLPARRRRRRRDVRAPLERRDVRRPGDDRAVGDASEADLVPDAGGRLHAVYPRLDAHGYHLRHAVSDDGATWQSGSVDVQADDRRPRRGSRPPPTTSASPCGSRAAARSASRSVRRAGRRAAATAVPPRRRSSAKTVVRRQPVSGTVRVRLKGSRASWRSPRSTTSRSARRSTPSAARSARARCRRAAARSRPCGCSTGSSASARSGAITNFTLNEPLAPCPARERGREEAEDAQAVGRRQGRVPHQRPLQRGDGPRHALARPGHLRGDAHARDPGQRVPCRDRQRRVIVVRAGKRYLARAP